MATHYYPPENDKPLVSYINHPSLALWAQRAFQILQQLPELKVWQVQYKRPGVANTCWYVSMKEQAKPFLINFTIVPSNLNVEFRFSQYLPVDIFEQLKWQNTSWRYATLKESSDQAILTMIQQYLKNIQPAYDQALLKPGGQSFAEEMIRRIIEECFPNTTIRTNIRPNELRSSKNRPLELDIYMPDLSLAIEIQGPQHFQAIYGDNAALKKNDQLKKAWCQQQGIKLMWMNWDAINKDLLKLSLEERTYQLNKTLQQFLDNDHHFCWWQGVSKQFWE